MEKSRDMVDKLLESWELQQNSHIRFREDRFSIMFDYVEQVCGDRPRVLDVACGPGSLSRRFSRRFPGSRITSVDYDPVLLYIAENTVATDHENVSFVEGDLRRDEWFESLELGSYDCAMSTTAIHWLSSEDLVKLYRNIHKLLKPGGVFLNGDHLISEARNPVISENMSRATDTWSEREFSATGAPDWDKWWDIVRSNPFFTSMLETRSKRYSNPDNHNQKISLQTHRKYLMDAGFNSLDVIWQYSNDRILVATRY